MKGSLNLTLLALVAGWSLPAAAGQEAVEPAGAAMAQASVYDLGTDVAAPTLVPTNRTIQDPAECTRDRDDRITVSLIVDADGKPREVSVVHPSGTPVERLAQRVVEQDTFKPGMFRDRAVDVRLKLDVSIEGCYATRKDDAGNSTEVFRLRAQPVQQLAEKQGKEEQPPLLERIGPGAIPAEAYKLAAADVPGLERVGGDVSAPVPLNTVEAEFSDEARRKSIEGIVLVSMIVDTHGNPQNPRIVRAAGYGLDQKALEAVHKYKFKPAMKGKTPVPVLITVEVNFRYYNR